jgi:hypothetical protein
MTKDGIQCVHRVIPAERRLRISFSVVNVFRRSADNLLVWLKESKTAPYLSDCIMEYVRGQGDLPFQGICEAEGRFLRPLGVSQDKIGWRRFNDIEGI